MVPLAGDNSMQQQFCSRRLTEEITEAMIGFYGEVSQRSLLLGEYVKGRVFKGLSQVLKTGCPKWQFFNVWVSNISRKTLLYTQIPTINMYLLIEMEHNILSQYP